MRNRKKWVQGLPPIIASVGEVPAASDSLDQLTWAHDVVLIEASRIGDGPRAARAAQAMDSEVTNFQLAGTYMTYILNSQLLDLENDPKAAFPAKQTESDVRTLAESLYPAWERLLSNDTEDLVRVLKFACGLRDQSKETWPGIIELAATVGVLNPWHDVAGLARRRRLVDFGCRASLERAGSVIWATPPYD